MRAYEPVAVVRAGLAEVPNLPAPLVVGIGLLLESMADSNHHGSLSQCPHTQLVVVTPISGNGWARR
jgi:hypothetical protein